MSCDDCKYEGLKGLLIEPPPEIGVIESLTPGSVEYLIRRHFPDQEVTAAAAFWGIEHLKLARIFDLSEGKIVVPEFRYSNGKLLWEGECATGLLSPEKMEIYSALYQLLSYLPRRDGKYLLTTEEEGCCFPVIDCKKTSDSDFERVILSADASAGL